MAVERPPLNRLVLDDGSGLPLYRQVENDLGRRIQTGEWPAGSQIPSEPLLCAHYGVSRVTMREAVSRLVQQGMLTREQGRGTFVREPRLVAGARRVSSFSEELGELGLKAGARLLGSSVTTAGAEGVASELELADDAQVFQLRRLRTANGAPMGIQVSTLPLSRFPGIDTIDLVDRSLYAVLREHYGVVPDQAHETFTVDLVTPAESELLQIQAGSPVFHVHRLSFDAEGPFECAQSVMSGHRYQVRLHLFHP